MSQAVKVGIFMTAALALLAWLIFRVEDWSPATAQGRRVDALFGSVEGLDDKAAVRVAGVRVGRVDGIRLEGQRARVTLLLTEEVPLTTGARARIASVGLLGDKFLQLEPGPVGAPPLPPGATIPGETPVTFDQALAKLDRIGDSVEQLLGGGEGGAAPSFGPLVDSLRATADELRAVIAENRQSFGGTMRNFERFSATLAADLPRLTAQLDGVLAQVDGVLGENRENLKGSMANIREVTDRLQTSVDNLNDITGKIARGEGTIGKLVNSEQAHDELMSALGSVEKGVTALGDTLGRVQELQLDVGFESAYVSELEEARTAVRLDVLPHGDESPRLYRVELVTDPRGRVTEKTEIVTVTLPDGSTATTTTERVTQEDRREFSALFGFPFLERRGRLWAGVIENSAGLQVDYGLVPEKLSLSFEAFDFARELDLDPHLRLTASWYPFRNLYVRAGYDDPLVDNYRSPFVGAGLRWSDDDLKYLLGSVPRF